MGATHVLALLLLIGCSLSQRASRVRTPSQATHWPSIWHQMPSLQRIEVFAGHGKKLQATVPPEIAQLPRKFLCGDGHREVYHQIQGDRFLAFASAKYRNPVDYRCHLEILYAGEHRTFPLFDVAVADFPFETEHLNVPKKFTKLSAVNLARWKREVAAQKKVYASGVPTPHFRKPFALPLKSVVTSPYGRRRIFNNHRDSLHSGTDFRAAVGIPIPSANRGQIVFVGDLFFNGKTVIIDHGMNIFTMYCHLSKIEAEVGDMVDEDTIIGLAGMTGRASGPHLHWGVKVDQQWIDGPSFVREGI